MRASARVRACVSAYVNVIILDVHLDKLGHFRFERYGTEDRLYQLAIVRSKGRHNAACISWQELGLVTATVLPTAVPQSH